MPTIFPSFISWLRIDSHQGRDVGQGGDALQAVKTAIAAIAREARLSTAGIEALSRWIYWLAYAAEQARNPRQLAWPEWRTVLPVDEYNAVDNLIRVLRRAGEPQRVAREAAELAYRHETLLSGKMQASEIYAPLLSADTPALPNNAVMFPALPTWAKEMALFAANLAGKEMAAIRDFQDMDLSWLRAYYSDFGGCNVSGCKFVHADLRGASLKHAIKDGAVFDHAMVGLAPSLAYRSCPRLWPAGTPIGKMEKGIGARGAGEFLRDKEILQVLPFDRVSQRDGIEVGYIASGKAVIQQQHMRGSTAAVEAMLIADHGRRFDTLALRTADLGNNESIRFNIDLAGLGTITEDITSMEMLSEQIARAGPAKVGVANKELGLHPVIIDHIDLAASRVQLRDPFHGWAVIVTLDALTCRLHFPTVIIQVKTPTHTTASNKLKASPNLKA